MKVFLTGGTGFIGQHLIEPLLKRGWEIFALVRNPESPRSKFIMKSRLHLVQGDVTERESMRTSMHGADLVIHNAGHYEFGVTKECGERMRRINVDGTENVLSMALELNIQKVVYVSTVEAYGESGKQKKDETYKREAPCHTLYAQSKTDAHHVANIYRQKGLPLAIVMPNGVIGPNDHSSWGYFLRLYLNHAMPPICWSPKSVFSLVEVHDLAEGIALVAEKGRPGENYFLCGEPLTFKEHIHYWCQRPGGMKPILWLPGPLAAMLFTPLEPIQRWAGLPAFISRETAKAASENLNYCSEKAKQELGWSHRTAEQMWFSTIDEEMKLLAMKKDKNLVERLKILDVAYPG